MPVSLYRPVYFPSQPTQSRLRQPTVNSRPRFQADESELKRTVSPERMAVFADEFVTKYFDGANKGRFVQGFLRQHGGASNHPNVYQVLDAAADVAKKMLIMVGLHPELQGPLPVMTENGQGIVEYTFKPTPTGGWYFPPKYQPTFEDVRKAVLAQAQQPDYEHSHFLFDVAVNHILQRQQVLELSSHTPGARGEGSGQTASVNLVDFTYENLPQSVKQQASQ
jgi:hypothetical protein